MNKLIPQCSECRYRFSCKTHVERLSPGCTIFFKETKVKTTVTPEIKISVVDLHNSCPVSAEIKRLKEELEIYKKANISLTRDNTHLKTVLVDQKNLCEAYQKDAIMHHERRVRAIDLLKIVRDSAESQVDVINDFL